MKHIRFCPTKKCPAGFSEPKCFESRAKINLYLSVVGKRIDGYHLLQSIVAPVELHDKLLFAIRERREDLPVFYLIAQDELCSENNILCETFKKLTHAYPNIPFDLFVRLNKRVPLGGGMGGGSSDAGTLLGYLNTVLPKPLKRSKLMSIAAEIGADVPFFLEGRPALVEGIGERLTRLQLLPKTIPVVLVNPRINVSTRTVFEALRSNMWSGETPLWRRLKRSRSLTIKPPIDGFLNDLEKATFPLYPQIGALISELRSEGAFVARMSGSGSTVFGLFSSSAKAGTAVQRLRRNLPPGYWIQQTSITY